MRGGHVKKYGFKGGASRKNMVCKGGVTKKIACKFSSDSFYNRNKRRVIPACVVKAIRTRFLEESGEYVGFKPAEIDFS